MNIQLVDYPDFTVARIVLRESFDGHGSCSVMGFSGQKRRWLGCAVTVMFCEFGMVWLGVVIRVKHEQHNTTTLCLRASPLHAQLRTRTLSAHVLRQWLPWKNSSLPAWQFNETDLSCMKRLAAEQGHRLHFSEGKIRAYCSMPVQAKYWVPGKAMGIDGFVWGSFPVTLLRQFSLQGDYFWPKGVGVFALCVDQGVLRLRSFWQKPLWPSAVQGFQLAFGQLCFDDQQAEVQLNAHNLCEAAEQALFVAQQFMGLAHIVEVQAREVSITAEQLRFQVGQSVLDLNALGVLCQALLVNMPGAQRPLACGGASQVFIDGKPLACLGQARGGAVVLQGLTHVTVGGREAAFVGAYQSSGRRVSSDQRRVQSGVIVHESDKAVGKGEGVNSVQLKITRQVIAGAAPLLKAEATILTAQAKLLRKTMQTDVAFFTTPAALHEHGLVGLWT